MILLTLFVTFEILRRVVW